MLSMSHCSNLSCPAAVTFPTLLLLWRRYILWEAEDQGLVLPQSCRMGCCTACAVKVKEGQVYQPEALGVSEELRKKGYALMCVAFPDSDCVLETVPEDEVYDLQFGRYFAQQALDKNASSVERDDFALEIAQVGGGAQGVTAACQGCWPAGAEQLQSRKLRSQPKLHEFVMGGVSGRQHTCCAVGRA